MNQEAIDGILNQLIRYVHPNYRSIHPEVFGSPKATDLQLTKDGFMVMFNGGSIELHKSPWTGRPLHLTCRCETSLGTDEATQQMHWILLPLYERVVDHLLSA